jgi:AcrR family transcriptional regulator
MSGKSSRAAQTREKLLNSALHILQAHGAAGLTLARVADEAGVSKGGLLHHFPSKEALTEGLLKQLLSDFDASVQRWYEQEAAQNTPAAGRWVRAYIRASFEENIPSLEVSVMLLSSLNEHVSLFKLLQENFAHWQHVLTHDGIPAARATIIRQAADAVWMERLLEVDGPVERDAVMQEMLMLAEEAAS